MQVGTLVGARRWANRHAHPDCWVRPWQGVVISKYDPKAWANTIAFPTASPDVEAVKQHVDKCIKRGDLMDVIPVLWNFGDHTKVHWEKSKSLRTYDEDFAEWEDQLRVAYTACRQAA